MRLKNIHAVWLASILLLVASSNAAVAQVKSLIFERAEIRIDLRPITTTDSNTAITRPPIRLDVEQRGEDALTLVDAYEQLWQYATQDA